MKYENMTDTMHPDFCDPYTTGDEKTVVVVTYNGTKKTVAISTPDREILEATTDDIKALAQAVNSDYDLYRGWDNLHIALDAMRKTGCKSCPWRDQCQAMEDDDTQDIAWIDD